MVVTATSAFAINPALSLDQHVVRTWGADQGLPQGTVYSLAQSGDGYMWAATQEGFVRFDGTEFKTYDKATFSQIQSNMAYSLLGARDGSLYAATNGGGIVHVQGRRINTYTVADGLPSDSTTSLYESGNGTIWIGTQKGLAARQSDGRIVSIAGTQTPTPLKVTALAEDWSGQLWIGTTTGVATYQNGRLVRHEGDGFPTGHILTIRTSRDGSVWIGARGVGLIRYRSGSFRTYTTADGLPSAHVNAIYEDSNGTVWVGTLDSGVGRFNDEKFDFASDALGIGKKAVSSFVEDREGNLWIGSTNGLTRVSQGRVVSFTAAQGLLTEKIRTVTGDSNGTVWIGTGKGVQTLDGRVISKENGLSSDGIMTTLSTRDGALWVGTFDAGLNRVFQGATTQFNTKNGLNSDMILALYQDRGGVVWVGTAKGLQRIVNGILAPDTYKLSGFAVDTIYEDSKGAIWAGTQDGGLNRIIGANITSFRKAQGQLASDLVVALHEDSAGTLWVGTVGGGLSRFKGGRWTNITTREGLFDDSVLAILEDANGFFWMSSNKGIFRVSRQQLDELAEGLVQKVTSVSYGRADGMASRECNGGTQPAAWKTPDGKLWFATVKGVAMIDSNRARAAAAPPVVIDSIFADRKPLDPSGPITLTAGTKTLEFRYTGISLAGAEKVHYEYKLDGFDRDWIDAGARRMATYTNLKPGTYRFHVRAAMDDGPWSTNSTSIKQNAFFYQTPWFLGGVALLLISMVIFAHRTRVKVIRASAERFKQLFDRNPAGEYRANAAGGILDCNEACARMLGYNSRAALMGAGIATAYGTESDWQTVVTRLKDQGTLAGFETSLRRADGAEVWVLMNASMVSDANGNSIVACTLVDITDRKRAEEEVRYKAHHDVLTGLPNRALFKDRLAIALNYAHRAGNQLAVLHLDLDSFNVVNEAFGREGGDALLNEVAKRLKACVREEDSVARVGDDEFALLLMKPANVGDVTAVARARSSTRSRSRSASTATSSTSRPASASRSIRRMAAMQSRC
jgi:diguanylate cyclase (GGDEF)-like protein/PAS domain S-box-containing protein